MAEKLTQALAAIFSESATPVQGNPGNLGASHD